uniref:Mediator of RNA polymerase II transcription subunit 31 n=2 Tax=Helianthus annuus TaxID=4232 RepID=A0A251V6K7_HELAN
MEKSFSKLTSRPILCFRCRINLLTIYSTLVDRLKDVERDCMASGQEIDDSSNKNSSPKKVYKDPDDGRQRFLLELEFVQCLANPTYIHYLAQNRYFEDEAFIGYLKYLQYWQRPEYIKYIMYPHCLYFLELLQNASFRNAMAHPANKELTHRQQFYFWKNYRNNRLKHILPRPLPEPTAAPPSNALPPPLPPSATTMATSSAPVSAPPVPSPMQYGVPSGPPLVKNDPRNAIDRRKRKKDG